MPKLPYLVTSNANIWIYKIDDFCVQIPVCPLGSVTCHALMLHI